MNPNQESWNRQIGINMKPHSAHVREYYRHIYPMKFALRLIPPVLIFGFLLGVFAANTWLFTECILGI